MADLNKVSKNLIEEVKLASTFKKNQLKNKSLVRSSSSTLALAYEKARNAVEYRDEHLIRQAAIERILRRRLFLNQSNEKIANLLLKELTWAKYIESSQFDKKRQEKLKKIINKYRSAGLLVPNSNTSQILTGLCACEIDEFLNFDPINQIIINYVTQILNKKLIIDIADKTNKDIQTYIAVERGFAKNSEMLIRYKLLKVLLPNWEDSAKLLNTLEIIEKYLNYENRDFIRRKVVELSPAFNLARDFIVENQNDIQNYFEKNGSETLMKKLKETLEQKYRETKNKLLRASKRSIIYIFLTKMVFAILIEVPFDILIGSINYVVLAINILFPPTLMILFNSKVTLPNANNTQILIGKIVSYLQDSEDSFEKEEIIFKNKQSKIEQVFYYIFLLTSAVFVLGIIYFLSILGFNFISQLIFFFFLSVVSFFAFRVREISKDYLLSESRYESFLETLTDYLFLPVIKVGQWLSIQVSKINILSFIFDFIIEAPLKTFLEIFEQWLHFVRVKKEEFLG
jgi:hypothetical protein